MNDTFNLSLYGRDAERVISIINKIEDVEKAKSLLTPWTCFTEAHAEIDDRIKRSFGDLGQAVYNAVREKKERDHDA